MFCKNCGAEILPAAAVCTKCGAAKGVGVGFCQNCGQPVNPNAAFCLSCGAALTASVQSGEQKSKLIAALLGIFLGGLGVHNFYLGNTKRAVLQLLLTVLSFGIASLWGFIEGILILTGNIKTDAKGVPLKE